MATRADVFIHPVRIRIISVLHRRNMTPLELAAVLSDVPQATLYRHIHALAEAGILDVVEERQVRSVTEKVYTLTEGQGMLSREDIEQATPDDLKRYFTIAVTGILGGLTRYVDSGDVDLERDHVAVLQAALFLTDEQVDAMVNAIRDVIVPLTGQPPGPGRTLRTLNIILYPDATRTPDNS
jgi:DNA-binding transcriptional ArsR family regulator